jgi:glycosyltransferase involved in cell wall biosynthesis
MENLPEHSGRSRMRRLFSTLMWSAIRAHNSKVIRHSDGIVLCSVDDRDFILRDPKVSPDKLLALAPGISPDFLGPMTNLEGREKKLLYIGQFTAHKAPRIVAEIANEAMSLCSEATLTWVCSANDHPKVLDLIRGDLHSRMTLLPWMPREQLRSVYDEHGILLFPSRFEGFSLTFLEAMARGLCVLASSIDGMRQTIVHGATGFLFPVDAVPAFVQQLICLLRTPEATVRIGQAARASAERFTWDRTASELLSFYDRRIAAKAAR